MIYFAKLNIYTFESPYVRHKSYSVIDIKYTNTQFMDMFSLCHIQDKSFFVLETFQSILCIIHEYSCFIDQ